LTVPGKLTPTVATTIRNEAGDPVTSAPVGTMVHDTVTLSGSGATPTGDVTFHLFSGSSSCQGTGTDETVALASGAASSTAVAVPAGGLSYTLDYAGDDNYDPSASDCESLEAEQLSPADEILDLIIQVRSSSIDDNVKKQLIKTLDDAYEALTGEEPPGARLAGLRAALAARDHHQRWAERDSHKASKKCDSRHNGAPDDPDVRTACRELSFFVRDVERYANLPKPAIPRDLADDWTAQAQEIMAELGCS